MPIVQCACHPAVCVTPSDAPPRRSPLPVSSCSSTFLLPTPTPSPLMATAGGQISPSPVQGRLGWAQRSGSEATRMSLLEMTEECHPLISRRKDLGISVRQRREAYNNKAHHKAPTPGQPHSFQNERNQRGRYHSESKIGRSSRSVFCRAV
jgi:hypothetical protein